jgi:uncharacterized membrane protein YhiD involved in acid resistance
MVFSTTIWPLVVALAIGILLGSERERRKGTGPARGAAGLRTFALVALLGALAATTGEAILSSPSPASSSPGRPSSRTGGRGATTTRA